MATVAVRMNEVTKANLDALVKKINKSRAKENQLPLTIAQVIHISVEAADAALKAREIK